MLGVLTTVSLLPALAVTSLWEVDTGAGPGPEPQPLPQSLCSAGPFPGVQGPELPPSSLCLGLNVCLPPTFLVKANPKAMGSGGGALGR